MSFDLAVFDFDTAADADDIDAHYEGLCDADGTATPGPRVAAFIAECKQRWPGDSDEDFDDSPWSTWPLEGQATTTGLVANIRWSAAEDMLAAWLELAERHGLTLYDPQEDRVYLPTGLAPPP